MMLPNNFDTTPFVLSNLKTKQRAFVQHLYDAGHTTTGDIVFKRNYLKTIANMNGSAWAPAWIVKDVSRVTNRGMYAVPELNELIEGMTAVVTTDVSPGHGHDGDDLADAVHDDLDETITVSDDMMASTVVV